MTARPGIARPMTRRAAAARAVAMSGLLAGGLLALAGGARAQDPLAYTTPEGMRQFQLCRAAVFYHLDDQTRGDSVIPVSHARIMRAQIEFLMTESIFRAIPGSLAEGSRILEFTERFYIDFSRTLSAERSRLLDVPERERILFECGPFLWATTAAYLDNLMNWRKEAIGAPPPPDPAREMRKMEDLMRRLSE